MKVKNNDTFRLFLIRFRAPCFSFSSLAPMYVPCFAPIFQFAPSASGNTAKISKTVKTIKATSTKGVTKGKPKPRGTGGGQRPAVQAPVSTPQGTVGGGPGSFCSKVRGGEGVKDYDNNAVRVYGNGSLSESLLAGMFLAEI